MHFILRQKSSRTRTADLKKHAFLLTIIVALFALIAIALCFPVTGDDWYHLWDGLNIHSIQDVLNMMRRDYLGKDGRMFGNILAEILGNRPAARALIRAAIIWGISLFLYRITKPEEGTLPNVVYYLTSLIFVLSLPAGLFRETYSWAAGFFNYVPPVLFLLMYLYYMKSTFWHRSVHDTYVSTILFFLLGSITQLFIEHMTIFTLIFAIFAVWWHRFSCKRFSITTIAYFVGTCIGAGVMFSSPTYQEMMARNTDKMISFRPYILIQIMRRNLYRFIRFALGNNLLLLIVLSVCGLILLYQVYGKVPAKRTKWVKLTAFILLIAPICSLFDLYLISNAGLVLIAEAFLCGLYVVAIVSAICFSIKTSSKRNFALFCTASAVVSVVPMLFTSLIGYRCFYVSYVFLIIVALIMLFEILNKGISNEALRFVQTAVLLVAILVCLYHYFLFFRIPSIQALRNTYIEEQMRSGSMEITVPTLPNDHYLHHPYWNYGLVYHYSDNTAPHFVFMEWQQWLAEYANSK